MKKLCTLLFVLFVSNIYAQTKILFIGDSHSVGIFGHELDKKIRSLNKIELRTYASCGAVASWFIREVQTPCGYFFHDHQGVREGNKAKTPNLKTVLNTYRPDIVLIELGGNYAGRTSEYTQSDVKDALALIENYTREIYWVGAPDSRKKADEVELRIYDDLKQAINGRYPLFISRDVTTYPATGGDGIHYWGVQGSIQAKSWATKVFEWLLANTQLN